MLFPNTVDNYVDNPLKTLFITLPLSTHPFAGPENVDINSVMQHFSHGYQRFFKKKSYQLIHSHRYPGILWITTLSAICIRHLIFIPTMDNLCSISNNHIDRKSTLLNSSHANISYAVFCLKKKKKKSFSITSHKTVR